MRFLILCLCLFQLAYASERYVFKVPNGNERFQQLTQELRCLVCQNEDLASSQAPLAEDLRQKIVDQINQGESNESIKQYLVSRYGNFVLYKPPVEKATELLWYGPFAFLLIGVTALFFFIRRKRA